MSVTYPKLTAFYRSMKELGILSYDDVTKQLAASDKYVDNIELDGNQEKFVRNTLWRMSVVDKINKRKWIWSSWQWTMQKALTWFRTTVHNNNKRRRRWEYLVFPYSRREARMTFSSNELVTKDLQYLIGDRIRQNLLVQREEFFNNTMGYNRTAEFSRVVIKRRAGGKKEVHHIPFKKLSFGYYNIFRKNSADYTFMTHMSGWTGVFNHHYENYV